MPRDRAGGYSIIAGVLAGFVTMAVHPTGRALLGDFERVAPINRFAHALAIAGTIATFYGLVRLTRAFENQRSLTDAALVVYGFGAIAVMFAAIASGFIGTSLAEQILLAGGDARTAYEPVQDLGWALNQACTRVFVVTASIGIGFWSLAMLREPRFGRGLGLTGLVVGAAAIVATLVGMPMDIHGFGAIVLGHGIWLTGTASRMIKS